MLRLLLPVTLALFFVHTSMVLAQEPCVVPDNGNGTANLPPEGCGYVSPQDLHLIIDGLPPMTTIEVAAEHTKFFQVQTMPGGSLGGEVEVFQSILQMQMTGTGALAGFSRFISMQLSCEAHTGPRTPGDPVQTFPNDMFLLQGELFGDPDFDLISIVGGTGNGLPSPGSTTLTQLPGGNFNVDSFFDVSYTITFQGAPGSILEGLAGTTTGTVLMAAGEPIGPTPGEGTTIWATQPDSGQILMVDPTTGAITGSFLPPDALLPGMQFQGLSIAEGGTSLIYINLENDPTTLFRLDPLNGLILSVESLLGLATPASLSYQTAGTTGPTIYTIDNGTGIFRQDGFSGPVALHNIQSPTFPGAQGGDDAGREFCAVSPPGGPPSILEYDPVTGADINLVPDPTFVAGPGPGGGMAFDGTFLYMSDVLGNLLTIDPDTGVVLNSVFVPGGNLTGLGALAGGTPPSIWRGDCDGDNVFNGVLDGIFLLNFQFVSGSDVPPCLAQCDADGDTVFNGILDGIHLLNFQFVPGSPPIPPPFPCGVETPPFDSLGVLGCNTPTCP